MKWNCCTCCKSAGSDLLLNPEGAAQGKRAAVYTGTTNTLMSVLKDVEIKQPGEFQQAGGHEGALKTSEKGETVTKATIEKEQQFYVDIYKAREEGDEESAWPIPFAPKFYGLPEKASDSDEPRVTLENLLHGYKHPCILDLKIGTRTAEENEARKMKKLRMAIKDFVVGSVDTGVQLVSMSVYNRSKKTQKVAGKAMGAFLTSTNSMAQLLGIFLTRNAAGKVNLTLTKAFAAQIDELLAAFKAQKTYTFIGSSLLFVYEGAESPFSFNKSAGRFRPVVKMIDFAHVNKVSGGKAPADEGYVTGLETLSKALNDLQSATHVLSVVANPLTTKSQAQRWRKNASARRELSQSQRKAAEGTTAEPPAAEKPAASDAEGSAYSDAASTWSALEFDRADKAQGGAKGEIVSAEERAEAGRV